MRFKRNTKLCIAVAMIIVFVCWYLSENYFQLMLIQGRSMMPTYGNLQFVLLNKHDKEYKSGDVIAFRCEKLNGVIVKRIIAVPGDRVCIRKQTEESPGTLYVNDRVCSIYPEESFAYAGILAREVSLSEGEYIVIGDNIAESHDSRYEDVGIVEQDHIIGYVIGGKER